MRIEKIIIIFRKELDDVVRSKYVLFSIIGLPLVFSIFIPAMSILPLMFTDPEEFESEGDDMGFLVNYSFTSDWEELNELQQFFIVMVEFSIFIFLMLPMILPTVIAADSFSGEKDRGTVEGLVAAPVSDTEIYLGKISGALVPTLFSTWFAAIPFVIMINIASNDILGRFYLPNLKFLIALLLMGPLLGLASTNAMVWVSTKTSSSRDAQQLGSLIILPLILIIIGMFAGVLMISSIFLWVGVIVLIGIDMFLIKIGINLLDREKWVTGT